MSKHILITVACSVLSGLIGFYIGTRYKKEEREEAVREAITEMRSHYKKKIKEKEEEYREKVCLFEEPKNPGRENLKNKPDLKDLAEEIQKRDLEEEEEIEEPEERAPSRRVDDKHDRIEKPYVINELAFEDECIWYDKLSYTWYAGNSTLLNECDQVVEDSRDEIGEEALEALLSGEEKCVYVRNEVLEIDYEIEVIYDDYIEM